MKKIKRIIVLFIVSLLCFSCFLGCENTSGNLNEKHFFEVENDRKDKIKNYDFIYEYNVPGAQLSYNYLWEGFDLENKFGLNLSEEKRLFTYLTEYEEQSDKYELVYLKQDFILENKQKLMEYEQNNCQDEANYHFTAYDEEKIIDGKYWFAYQLSLDNEKADNENFKVFETNDLEQVKFLKDDYQLVFCARTKTLKIKENLSISKEVNKEILVYKREELIFEDENSIPKKYEFESAEKENQTMVNKLFNYVGERIECYPQTVESLDYCNCPILGMKNYTVKYTIRADVVEENGKKYVILPRSKTFSTGTLDLLSYDEDYTLEEDIFRGYKNQFLLALYKDYISEGNINYSLYDYSSVVEIIKAK